MSPPDGSESGRASLTADYAISEGMLQRLATERARLRGRTLTFFVGLLVVWGGVALGAYVLGMIKGPRTLILVTVGLLITSAAVYVIWIGDRHAEYSVRYKRQVIGAIARARYPHARYAPSDGLKQMTFRAAGLYRDDIDRFRSEDLIEGTIDEVWVRSSEVHAEYKTTHTDAKGRTRTSWHTIFDGYFCVAEFPKSFSGSTIVLPDTAERLLGSLGRSFQRWHAEWDGLEFVRLEDPEFERQFVVHGSDQIEARYILSPSLMRRLVKFREQLGIDIRLAFRAQQMYLAIEDPTDRFEPPSIWRSELVREADVARWDEELSLPGDVVRELRLHRDLWG